MIAVPALLRPFSVPSVAVGSPRRRTSGWTLAGALFLAGHTAVAAPELLDRTVALVDEEPILLSDLDRVISLGLVSAADGSPDDELRRRALDGLIEERLRFHEVDRFGFDPVPLELVDDQVAAVAARFPEEELAERLEAVGLDEDGLRQLLSRQLEVLIYVEERLGARVFVGLDDVRRYYDEELVPALEAEEQEVPPLEEVREEIRALLRERRLGEELERWTDELRREADVLDLLDESPLPPLPALPGVGGAESP